MINFSALIPGYGWQHPHTRLRSTWNYARVGAMVFPFMPLVGLPLVFTALIQTWVKCHRALTSHRLNWGWAGLGMWLIFVSLLAPNPGEAALGLANFLPYFFFFVAYSFLIQTTEQLRQLAWILLLSSLPIVVCGLGQMWWGWGGRISIVGRTIELLTVAAGGDPPGRMASIFMHANSLAAYLQMVFIFSLGLAIDTYERRPKNWQTRINWLLLYLVICGYCLMLTSSRSGWVMMVVGVMLFTLYRGWYWAIAIVSALTTIVLSAAYAPSPLKESLRAIVPRYLWARITDEMYPDRPYALTRISQWKFAWNLTQQRPLTGWGLQSFGRLYEPYAHLWLGYPHSLLLMLSSNVGIPATLMLLALVGWILAQAVHLFLSFPLEWRSERTIFFTYLVSFTGFIIFNLTDVSLVDFRLNTLAWLLLASIYGLVRSNRSRMQNSELQVEK
jgi:O-antigen ligase